MLRCSPNTFVLGLIIHPDESFLVSTPIKVKGIESEKGVFPSMQWSLCRSYVTDDTRLYAYFIGTCIFYSIILGTPLLCSQTWGGLKKWRFSLCGCVISEGEKCVQLKCVLAVTIISVQYRRF